MATATDNRAAFARDIDQQYERLYEELHAKYLGANSICADLLAAERALRQAGETPTTARMRPPDDGASFLKFVAERGWVRPRAR